VSRNFGSVCRGFHVSIRIASIARRKFDLAVAALFVPVAMRAIWHALGEKKNPPHSLSEGWRGG
jgi:hypothetical protein